jgi:tetratricopeptide (TPR) repeat protein
MTEGWKAISVAELDAIPVDEGLVWHPIRRRLGIRAFGINAYTSDSLGGQVVEEHDETGSGAGGHEELYIVMRGRATFTLDGEILDAPAGTLVFINDPRVKRVAIAEEDGTLVLAVGGEPGRPYAVSAWEFIFAVRPLMEQAHYADAIELLEEGLRELPENPALLYNLARAESRGGRPLDALVHLQTAVRAKPEYRMRARTDPAFGPVRREQGFPG